MAINIYSVINHLEQEKWRFIDGTYKNLTSELEVECPNGHKQTISYGQWRKHPVCEICMAGNIKKLKKESVPIKTIDTQRILALDAATNVTGYAIFDKGELVYYNTYKTNHELPATARIHEVKEWLKEMIEKYEFDFIMIENIQLQSYSQGQYQVELYRTLAQLQGVLLDTIFEACIDCDLVYATVWRKYCGVSEGTGRENKKKAAQNKVKLWYGQDCTQDEADAICIGKYACSQLKKSSSSWGEDIE